jgi:hypothetical protein
LSSETFPRGIWMRVRIAGANIAQAARCGSPLTPRLPNDYDVGNFGIMELPK